MCFYSTKSPYKCQNSLPHICSFKGIVAIFVPLFLLTWGQSKIHTTQWNFEHNYIQVWNCDTTVTGKYISSLLRLYRYEKGKRMQKLMTSNSTYISWSMNEKLIYIVLQIKLSHLL